MIMSAPVCVCDNGRFIYSVMVCKGEKFRFEYLPKVDHSRAQHGTYYTTGCLFTRAAAAAVADFQS